MSNTIGEGLLGFLKGSASALILGASLAALPSAVQAQQADQTADDSGDVDQIVITGSRIRRDEFSSPAPLQTYNIDAARQIGISSIGELLQRTTIANGQQIDTTLNTNAGNSNASEPPPIGGVGSSNIGLRGLGSERTLVLINNKRLGSAGVRGAPSQPDLNLLPLNLVERIEVITEGASSIYGADAVAGVVNILLRDSFEGFEVSGNIELPEAGGGEIFQTSFITGATTSNAKFVFSGEFFEQQRASLGSRVDCLQVIARDADGNITSFCNSGFFDNVIGTGTDGSPSLGLNGDVLGVFYTPGETNIGVPNFSNALALPVPTADGAACERTDQRCRFPFIPFFNDQDERLAADLIQPQTRFSLVSLGSYQPDFLGGDSEIYYEAYYFNRHSGVRGSSEQIFPTIPGNIPQEDANGNIVVDSSGAPILAPNPLNPFGQNASPIITLDVLRQDRRVELQQARFVGGLRGDFWGDNWLAENNWSYDLFTSYDRGTGFASQPLLNESNLILALETLRLDADGNPVCGVPVNNNDFGFLTPQQCVPLDFFNDSVFRGGPNGEGQFATEEENDFLFGTRTNRTVVEQFLAGTYFTGDLFEMPDGGTVGLAFGAEFRKDSISSAADFLSSNALNAAENPLAEGETFGSRNIFDLYAELNVPLLANREMADYLAVEGAVRYTEEENFGSETTYRARFIYRPVDWIQTSGSYGTSFRAPNLREQFLADQLIGVSSNADPCGVPPEANIGGVFDPTQDTRPQVVIDNCILDGADPTRLGLIANINIPATVGGNADDLVAETSRTFTATVQVTPPISDQFDIELAVSFFDIKVEDTVRALAPETILARCFQDAPGLASPFCDRLTRTQGGQPEFQFVNFIDDSFINLGEENSQGIDVNARFRTDIEDVAGKTLSIAWAGAITFQTQRNEQIFAGDPFDNLNGDFGVPKRRLTSNLSLGLDRFEFIYETRHISGTQSSDTIQISADCNTFSDNLSIAGTTPTAPLCSAPGRWYHDASLTYRLDNIVFTGGVRNLLDKDPPFVSAGAGSNRGNRVTSSGYDQLGRTFFFTATTAF